MFSITPLHSKINQYLLNRNHPSASDNMDDIFDILKDALPHGSGIDCKWEFESTPGSGIVHCHNSFHAMDQNGYYCGYVSFTVTILLQSLDYEVSVTREHIDAIMKDYEPEGKDEDADADFSENAPYLDDLDDYLHETIHFALEQYIVQHTLEFAKGNYPYLVKQICS